LKRSLPSLSAVWKGKHLNEVTPQLLVLLPCEEIHVPSHSHAHDWCTLLHHKIVPALSEGGNWFCI